MALSQQELQAMSLRIQQDPQVRAILADPQYSTPMLRNAAVNNYLTNNPTSPLYALVSRESPNRGAFTYQYDPETRQLRTENYGPQHWYTDPASKGVQALAGVGMGAVGGAIPGLPGYQLGGAEAAAPTTTQSMYDAGMFGGPSGTASGVAAGHAGLGTVAPVAGGAGASLASSIKEKLLSPQGIATLATAIPALIASRSGNGATDDATNALMQEALKRSQRVDPLHQAVTQLAFSRLPDSARNGITLTGK